jgi:hypothetical protein
MLSSAPLRVRELKKPRERKTLLPASLERRVPHPSLFVQHGRSSISWNSSSYCSCHCRCSSCRPLLSKPPSFYHQTTRSAFEVFYTLVYHTMPDGQTLILKDTSGKHTSISRPTDHKLKAQTNGSKSILEGPEDSLDIKASAFTRLDERIDVIVQQILPDIPHLVSVPTKTPYVREFPNENLNTPFEDWEVQKLQHMTLVSNGSRGVAWVKGNWLEEYNAASPYSGVRSGTATPRSERDANRIRTKMTLADYKANKRPTSSFQPPRLGGSQTVPNGHSRYDID